MNRYYICNYEIAKSHCVGLLIKYVHYYKNNPLLSQFYNGYIPLPTCKEVNATLLINIDNEMQLILTLIDPEFKEIAVTELTNNVLDSEWKML